MEWETASRKDAACNVESDKPGACVRSQKPVIAVLDYSRLQTQPEWKRIILICEGQPMIMMMFDDVFNWVFITMKLTVVKFLFWLCKILIPPILWISILLLDGDYYTCAKIDITEVANTTCVKFQCDRDLNNFLTGQRHHCDFSRLIGGLLIFVSLVCLLFFYFIYYYTYDKSKYRYEIEYICIRKNKETQIMMEKLTEKANENAQESASNKFSEQFSLIPGFQSNSGPSNLLLQELEVAAAVVFHLHSLFTIVGMQVEVLR
ncbi:uncharacterized protein LOC125486945 [Rhincodon typus]|uniref:uncharacterized protein LOC125486945 n=1 Tax=Rhincodon typus TaxID=259920 RepID=UPI002030B3BE|nr:uncharacterized protein LOC125486945 [Rhincodon typus]